MLGLALLREREGGVEHDHNDDRHRECEHAGGQRQPRGKPQQQRQRVGELIEQAAPPARAGLAANLVRSDLLQAARGFALVQPADLRAQVSEQPRNILLGIEVRDRDKVRGRERHRVCALRPAKLERTGLRSCRRGHRWGAPRGGAFRVRRRRGRPVRGRGAAEPRRRTHLLGPRCSSRGSDHAGQARQRGRDPSRAHAQSWLAANKLACLFWWLLTREVAYAYAQPSLTHKRPFDVHTNFGSQALRRSGIGEAGDRRGLALLAPSAPSP